LARINWTKEKITNEITRLYNSNIDLSSGYTQKTNASLYNAAKRHLGGWKQAIEYCGIDYESDVKKNKHGQWNKNSIIKCIIQRHSLGKSLRSGIVEKDDAALACATRVHFGSWKKAVEKSGFDYASITERKFDFWSKERVKQGVISLLEKEADISSANMMKTHSDLMHAGICEYGSWRNCLEELGIDYMHKITRTKRDYWTKEKTIECIKEVFITEGKLSSLYMKYEHGDLYNAGRRCFGTWENAVQESGIMYSEVIENCNTLSSIGRSFEKIVDYLISEIGINFKKYEHRTYKPDYVFKNDIWADAKLSEWSVYCCDTIEKYEPCCRLLTIIYMRGNPARDEMLTNKTRIISVHKLIKQLPRSRRRYYLEQIASMESAIKKVESIESKDECSRQFL
jgi:nuclear transport factor 2 (NTF2) superfamily protein